MKLNHLLNRSERLSVKRSTSQGERVDTIVHHDSLPNVRIEYANIPNSNTSLKIKMLVDDRLPDDVDGRNIDVCLYSDESLQTFFGLIDLIREMVTSPADEAPTSHLIKF